MSIQEPLISIALCTYNGDVYLSSQLDSILNQTYRNTEIIIVDDCSTDETSGILSRYANYDPRIKVYKNQTNIGYNKNFEKAISLTTGKFIALCDQDDVWSHNKVTELYNAIGNNWVVFSNSQLINIDGNLLDSILLKNFEFKSQNFANLLLNNYVTGHTCLLKREALIYVLPFPDEGFYDWWIGFIALYHNKLIYLNKVLTNYRIHPNSVVQTINKSALPATIESCKLALQLSSFLNYSQLNKVDYEYINGILQAVKQQKSGHPLKLLKIIVFKYSIFFSHYKPRNFLSRLNFARNFFRKM